MKLRTAWKQNHVWQALCCPSSCKREQTARGVKYCVHECKTRHSACEQRGSSTLGGSSKLVIFSHCRCRSAIGWQIAINLAENALLLWLTNPSTRLLAPHQQICRPDLPDRAQLIYAGVRHRIWGLDTKRQGYGAKAPGGAGGGQAGLDSSPAGRQLHPGMRLQKGRNTADLDDVCDIVGRRLMFEQLTYCVASHWEAAPGCFVQGSTPCLGAVRDMLTVLSVFVLQRFRPITVEKPKVLLPLVNVPLLEYTLEWLALNEVEEVRQQQGPGCNASRQLAAAIAVPHKQPPHRPVAGVRGWMKGRPCLCKPCLGTAAAHSLYRPLFGSSGCQQWRGKCSL